MACDPQTAWPDARIEQLKILWAGTLSCTGIGAVMGISRSAVIGKVHRLGLPLRGSRKRTPEEREEAAERDRAAHALRQSERRARQNGIPFVEMPKATALPPFAGSLNIPFADLRTHKGSEQNQCRYIAAEPAGPDFRACGNDTAPGESWCAHCKSIVYARPPVLSAQDRTMRRMHFLKLGLAVVRRKALDLSEEAA